MRLARVRVQKFKSVWDSGEFEVSDITCLVGKNESGKTTLLQALYRLNPIVEGEEKFDVTEDYPRMEVEDYLQGLEAETSDEHRQAIVATFTLDTSQVETIEDAFGSGVLASAEVEVARGYDKNGILWVNVKVNEDVCVRHLVASLDLSAETAKSAAGQKNLKALGIFLEADAEACQAAFTRAQTAAQSIEDAAEKAAALSAATDLQESAAARTLRTTVLPQIANDQGLGLHLWRRYIQSAFPKFLYFDEYYQMTGQVNVKKLQDREKRDKLEKSDRPMLGLIDLARLRLDDLMSPQNTQQLKVRLQGASNHLSKQILKYWSQNKHVQVQFDVRQALPGDPPDMNEAGTMNLWGEVYDSAHGATVRLGTRSKGFIWFFSFLAWFSQQRKKDIPIILLLDEPGLVLHASAQADLLAYIETELKPHHQVLYTTHSPFMVDPTHFDRVRIVRDRSMEADDPLPDAERGTKVFTDILEADPDSLFPLQGALGYDIAQTLFVGPNSLIIEGVSDLLYLPIVSGLLSSAGRTGLSDAWTLTPVGGSDKVPTFVSLLGAQRKLNLATLIDFQKKDRQTIDNLYKKRLLKKEQVLTFADFTKTAEADIEDMFTPEFYVELVNAEYRSQLQKPIEVQELPQHPRILVRIEKHLEANPLSSGGFNHFRPARFLSENLGTFSSRIDGVTLDRFEAAFTVLNGLLKSPPRPSR